MKPEIVELNGVTAVDLPRFSVEEWIGKEVEIASVVTKKGDYGYYVEAETDVVTTIGVVNPMEIRARKRYGLIEMDGKICWGNDTKLGLELKRFRVNHYNELKGIRVKLQATKPDKDGNRYLTF